MVMKMNNKEFLKELQNKTSLTDEEIIKMKDIFEEDSIFGKRNKEKTVNAIMESLNIDYDRANEIYDITCSIVTHNIKEKIKHPFKSKN